MALYLSDGPYTWYRQLPNATKQNLALLQAAFNTKYAQHDGLTWALRAQLTERSQKATEAVEDYAEDIEKRCGQLQINGQQLLETFIRGLRPGLRAAVIKDHPANVTDAINAARVAQSLELPLMDPATVAKTVKDAITEQLQSVKEELAALTINAMAPGTEQLPTTAATKSRPEPATPIPPTDMFADPDPRTPVYRVPDWILTRQ